jgi:hypothetical protein
LTRYVIEALWWRLSRPHQVAEPTHRARGTIAQALCMMHA